MEWYLTKPPDGILLGGLGSATTSSITTGKQVTGLLPGSLNKEYLIGETPITVSTFLTCFAAVHGEFSCQGFWPLG